jgi:itaconate CoA-transferase
MNAGPLDGITVVSIEQAVAAPLATRHLADLGARVIKVERPDGGDFARQYDTSVNGLSAYFVWANRSKESITLNLKDERAREVAHALVARADVFVQNLAPGGADGWGLGGAALRERHPSLVVCEISGYGVGGPWADRKAYDLLVQAESGFLTVTGTPEEVAKAGISIADIAAGMYCYSGILGALLARSRTGEGSLLSVSLLDALAEWMSMPLYYDHYSGRSPRRTGARHATIAPYGPYATASGGPILLGVQNEREWRRLCEEVIGRPDLVDDPRYATNPSRVEHIEELERVIGGAFATASHQELAQRLDDAGIAYARVSSLPDVWDHPQLRARGRFVQIDSPAGSLEVLRPPAEPPGGARFGPVPALGADTDTVLAWLGIGSDVVKEWRAEGVV